MTETYDAVVAAGSYRSSAPTAVAFAHRWTDEGVTVDATFTGAHMLHVAVAGCVLNDLYREARSQGIVLDGVRVTASGEYDGDWATRGITYCVELDSKATPEETARLLVAVDEVAEVPRAVRRGGPVTRVS